MWYLFVGTLLFNLSINAIEMPNEDEFSDYNWATDHTDQWKQRIFIQPVNQKGSSPQELLDQETIDHKFGLHFQGLGNAYLDRETQLQHLMVGANVWDEVSVFIGGTGRQEDSAILYLRKYCCFALKSILIYINLNELQNLRI